MKIIKFMNLALSFILELCLLGALGLWGFKTGKGMGMQIILGIGIPLVVVVLWALLLAPASSRRLKGVSNVVLKALLFGLATAGLIAAGMTIPGILFGLLFIVNMTLAIIWKQEPFVGVAPAGPDR